MDNIIKVNFEEWQEVQHDNSLKQWSYGQVLKIEGLKLPEGNVEVHFSLTENNGNANVLIGTVKNGVITVDIPRFILTKENVYLSSYNAYAWIYVDDGDTGQTIRKIVFEIESRPKPEDYVYTEDELKTYKKLEDKIIKLENIEVVTIDLKNVVLPDSVYSAATVNTEEAITIIEKLKCGSTRVQLEISRKSAEDIIPVEILLTPSYRMGEDFYLFVGMVHDGVSVNYMEVSIHNDADKPYIHIVSKLLCTMYQLLNYVKNEDLNNYVTFDDMASQSKPGLVKTYTAGGTGMDSQKRLVILVATEEEIKKRTTNKKVITPSNMDLAVKEVLTNSQIEWTEDEKKAVRIMLGIEEEELTTFICKCCGQEYSLDGEERQRYYDVDGNDVTEEVEASYGHYCTECIGGYAVEISCVNCGETDSIGNMHYTNGDWLCENCM